MDVAELVTRAWYLSGIVARELEQVSGSQISDGLFLLNQIIAEKSATGRFIPYYLHIEKNTVIGQESYFFEGLVSLDALVFTKDSVRYPMVRQNRRKYWGTGRVNTITALPYYYYAERVNGGTDIYLYYLPNSNDYVLTATGRFSLESVKLGEDILNNLDAFYVSYLLHLLAKRMCNLYNVTFAVQKERVLQDLEDTVIDVNPMDLRMKKQSTLTGRSILKWSDVNLGLGWSPDV